MSLDVQLAAAAIRAFAEQCDRTAKALKEWVIREDLRAWVEYDKAGAPYGYRRAGMHRWRSEQVARAFRLK